MISFWFSFDFSLKNTKKILYFIVLKKYKNAMYFILKSGQHYYMIVKMHKRRRKNMRHLMSPLDFTVEELDTLLDLAGDI